MLADVVHSPEQNISEKSRWLSARYWRAWKQCGAHACRYSDNRDGWCEKQLREDNVLPLCGLRNASEHGATRALQPKHVDADD